MDEFLQREILKLLAEGHKDYGEIRSRLNGLPLLLDVGLDEVKTALNYLVQQRKVEPVSFGLAV